MSDTKTPGDKTLSVTPPKTLSLKRPVEQSTVRQSFSHGRSKQVVVEVKRRVAHEPAAAPVAPRPPQAPQAPAAPQAPRPPQPAPAANRPSGGMLLRTLSDDEKDARQRALSDARATEAEARARAEEEARQRAAREARERAEREAAQARQREEEDRRRQEDEHKRRAESAARQRMSEETAPPRPAAPPREAAPTASTQQQPYAQQPRPTPSGPRDSRDYGSPRPPARDVGARPPRLDFRPPRSDAPRGPRPDPNATAEPVVARPTRQAPSAGAPRSRPDDGEARPAFRRPGGAPGAPRGAPAPAPKTPKVGEKPRGRLTLSTATGGDDERTRSLASFRRRVQRMTGHRASDVAKERVMREVIIPETITIQELANRMTERGVDVIRLLMKQGAMHKITDVIDADTA
ncbi:MAG: translation initiation factor IF-2, partial [Stutzerimonas stutzeri]